MVSIEEILTGGDPRSIKGVDEAMARVLASPESLGELFDCLFSADEIVRMRAGDALEKICRDHADWFAPFVERLLVDVPKIVQPSVQWHLAQMLAEVTLTAPQTSQALAILRHNLSTMEDWIVTNLTLESLAKFVRNGDFPRGEFVDILQGHTESRHKSVSSRVRKLLKEFG